MLHWVKMDGWQEAASGKAKCRRYSTNTQCGYGCYEKSCLSGTAHTRGQAGEPCPTQALMLCKSAGYSGMQISCASAENTGLLCLTSCRWKTTGNVSRSGFESWPVATINKKLKSFTVCTYSF